MSFVCSGFYRNNNLGIKSKGGWIMVTKEEMEMEMDLKTMEATKKYEADLKILNDCLHAVQDLLHDRTDEYEQELLNIKRDVERKNVSV
jgi:hypothetical protein